MPYAIGSTLPVQYLQGFFDDGIGFDMNRAAGPQGPGSLDRLGDRQPNEVVVLQHEPIRQVPSVVGRASSPNRCLLK